MSEEKDVQVLQLSSTWLPYYSNTLSFTAIYNFWVATLPEAASLFSFCFFPTSRKVSQRFQTQSYKCTREFGKCIVTLQTLNSLPLNEVRRKLPFRRKEWKKKMTVVLFFKRILQTVPFPAYDGELNENAILVKNYGTLIMLELHFCYCETSLCWGESVGEYFCTSLQQ